METDDVGDALGAFNPPLFFRAAADIKNMPFEIIEKDYWAVWVLEDKVLGAIIAVNFAEVLF